MQKDISSNKGITEDEGAEMPTFGADNGLKLSDLYGKDYDDEDWDKLLDQMSFDDMANLLTGNYLTNQIDSISKPKTIETDGPTGDTTSVTKNSFPAKEFGLRVIITNCLKESENILRKTSLLPDIRAFMRPA